VPADAPVRLAPTYSFVLARNFAAPDDDLRRVGGIRDLVVLVGERDECFYADRYAPLLAVWRPGTPVRVLPGVTHMGLITEPAGIAAVVAALQ
jgi:hypothetical protein